MSGRFLLAVQIGGALLNVALALLVADGRIVHWSMRKKHLTGDAR